MVKLPSFDNQASVAGSAPFQSVRPNTEFAEGAAALGSAFGKLAGGISDGARADVAKADRLETIQATSDSIDIKNMADEVLRAEIDSSDPAGKGLADRHAKSMDNEVNKLMASKYANSRNKEEIALRLKMAVDGYKDKAVAAEADMAHRFTADVTKKVGEDLIATAKGAGVQWEHLDAPLREHAATVSGNPKVQQKFYESMVGPVQKAWVQAQIDRNPETAAKAVQAYVNAYAADGSKVVRQDIQQVIDQSGKHGMPARTMLAIYKIESNMNPSHGRPIGRDGKEMSSAEGGFQVLNGNSPQAAATRSALGLTQADVKNHEKVAGALSTFLASKTAQYEAAGIKMTPGKQYMVWNMGEGAAAAVMRADPSLPIETVLSRVWASQGPAFVQKALNNNPSLYRPGMTVGQVQANYEAKMESAGKAADTAAGGLPPSAAERANQALSAVLPAGTFGHVRPADLADIMDTTVKRMAVQAKEGQELATGQARLSGAVPTDPFDSDHRKQVEKAVAPMAPEFASRIAAGDVDVHGQVRDMVGTVKHIPEPMLNAYRSVLLSNGNEDAKVSSFTALVELKRANPVAFAASKLPEDMKDRIEDYDVRVNYNKLAPGDAIKEIDRMHTEEGKKLRSGMKVELEKELKKVTPKSLSSDLSSGIFGGSVQLGFENINRPQVETAFHDTFKSAYRDLREQGKTPEEAKSRAMKVIIDTWGVTTAASSDGKRTLQPYPIEKTYKSDIGHEWVIEQAKHAASTEYVQRKGGLDKVSTAELDSMDVRLVPTIETEEDVRSGRPPRYDLWYRKPNGTIEKAEKSFKGDFASANASYVSKQRAKIEGTDKTAMPSGVDSATNFRDNNIPRQLPNMQPPELPTGDAGALPF